MNYIVLSTFNGERHVGELLDSLLAQGGTDFRILIRDDGSTDKTREILDRYRSSSSVIGVSLGENIGVVRSFFELFQRIPEDVQFVAFCDQDDIWEPDKLAASVKMLEDLPVDQPALYCCRMKIVDEFGRFLCLSDLPRRPLTFANALVQNIATGCTVTVNARAMELLRQMPDLSKVWMHDAWAYLAVSAFGTVLFDSTPRIGYRQHSNNVIGHATGIFQWSGRMKRFISGKHLFVLRHQAEEFHRVFGTRLPPQNRMLLERFIASVRSPLIERIRRVVAAPFYRQTSLDTFLLRLLIIVGRV